MEKLDLETTATICQALGDVREKLFTLAEAANRLASAHGPIDVNGLIQRANYSLAEAERGLSSCEAARSAQL
jgi:hypothetical protein